MSAMGKLSLQSFFCDALVQVDNGNFTVTFSFEKNEARIRAMFDDRFIRRKGAWQRRL